MKPNLLLESVYHPGHLIMKHCDQKAFKTSPIKVYALPTNVFQRLQKTKQYTAFNDMTIEHDGP